MIVHSTAARGSEAASSDLGVRLRIAVLSILDPQ
jgi:hypothetical protein